MYIEGIAPPARQTGEDIESVWGITFWSHPFRGLLMRDGDYIFPRCNYESGDAAKWRKVDDELAGRVYTWFGGSFSAGESGYISRFDLDNSIF